jgi:hypothetical protein
MMAAMIQINSRFIQPTALPRQRPGCGRGGSAGGRGGFGDGGGFGLVAIFHPCCTAQRRGCSLPQAAQEQVQSIDCFLDRLCDPFVYLDGLRDVVSGHRH